jgi:RNA polymerase sigma factor (sigma-70 family)
MDSVKEHPNAATLQILLQNHNTFLSFLRRRVESLELAEEILQSALMKAFQEMEKLDHETVVAWFYRVLRNAIIDHHRRRGAEERALAVRREQAGSSDDDPELERTICECFRSLLPTLKVEYRTILEQVDLGSQSVGDAAQSLGITPNNASVRLHRARLALRERLEQTCRTCAHHGCYDCTCNSC